VLIDGKRVIMAGSNNYMGLSSDPRVKEAAIAATKRFGSTCSGSRLLNGTLSLHAELEEKFAAFLKRDAPPCSRPATPRTWARSRPS